MKIVRSVSITFSLVLMLNLSAVCQVDYSSLIVGKWVTTESLLTEEIESTETSTYFKYEFQEDKTMYYATNRFERGVFSYFNLKNDKLEMFSNEYTILSCNEDQMEILFYVKSMKQYHKFSLVRKEKFDSLWKLKDEVKNHAFLTANLHLYDYLFSNFMTPDEFTLNQALTSHAPAVSNPKEDVLYNIKMIINPKGDAMVQSISCNREVKSRELDRLKRKIENSSGYWSPAKVNGKAVTDTLSISLVRLGMKSLDLKLRGLELFNKGYTLFQKGDYPATVQYTNDAIELDSTRFQYYILRAVCFLKLGETEKYCNDVVKAHSLNPFVKLTNVELVNGELQEIKCGRE